MRQAIKGEVLLIIVSYSYFIELKNIQNTLYSIRNILQSPYKVIYPLPRKALSNVISSAYSIEPACGSHFESLDIFTSRGICQIA
jgi:hypothetical protein